MARPVQDRSRIDRAPKICINAEQEGEVDTMTKQLREYGSTHGIWSLEDRVKRGLWVPGVFAVERTRALAMRLCEQLGVSAEQVEAMAIHIQSRGPWKYAEALSRKEDPVVRAWLLIHAANNLDKQVGGREIDMTRAEYYYDVQRLSGLLEQAIQDPELMFERATMQIVEDEHDRTWMDDGVLFSEMDSGYVTAAIKGLDAGVIQDADGLLHVGMAHDFDGSLLERWGLRLVPHDDERGRKNVPFYQNENGDDILKHLFPGYIIVLSRNYDLAKAIVQQREEVDPELLSHKIYIQSSASPEDKEFFGEQRIKRSSFIEPWPDKQFEDVGDQRRYNFYRAYSYLKALQIFQDASEAKRQDREARGLGIKDKDLRKIKKEVEKKQRQKMAEAQHIIDHIVPLLDGLPPNVRKIADLAGGAGDLALALTTEMLIRGREVDEARIVDPSEEYMHFNHMLVADLPHAAELQERVRYDVKTCQGFKPDADTIVVAKHACGDLADDIIRNWKESESPLLVIMTCCQEKACDCTAQYGIPQKRWRELCVDSAETRYTHIPERYQVGMAAMTELDNARVDYLNRFPGIEATLTQTDRFPKGDVIVVRRVSE